jgi:hypothetical protein
MAALNFPDPNVQTSYTNPNTGITYEWSNGIWKAVRTAQTAPELFVDVDGDNLTGNLTLGTDKIVLNATTGAATFASRLSPGTSSLNDHALVASNNNAANATLIAQNYNDSGLLFKGYNSSNDTVTINADGSATFGGDVTVSSTNADSISATSSKLAFGLSNVPQTAYLQTSPGGSGGPGGFGGNLNFYVKGDAANPFVKALELNYLGNATFAGSITQDGPWGSNTDALLLDSTGIGIISTTGTTAFNVYNGSYSDRTVAIDFDGSATFAGIMGLGTSTPRASNVNAKALHIHNALSGSNPAPAEVTFSNGRTGQAVGGGGVLTYYQDDFYLWNYENKDLIFATNNAERMRIDNLGNFGIGRVPVNNTVGYKLQLRSDTTQTYLQLSTSNHGDTLGDGLVIGIDNGAANIIQRENAPMVFFTNNQPRMRLDDLGRLRLNPFGLTLPSAGEYNTPLFVTLEGMVDPTSNAGGATPALIRTMDVGTTSAAYSGYEIRNRHAGDIRFLNGDAGLSNRANFAIYQDTDINDLENTLTISYLAAVYAPGVYDHTTSSGANVNVTSGGQLRRSTSSIRFKTNVETLENSYADALLNCRPVWYRSTAPSDNPEHSYWGFIAEEVAEIDPRLVQFSTETTSFVDAVDGDGNPLFEEDGTTRQKMRVKTTHEEPQPESVVYERFVPHLLNLIKRQKEAIETLEASNADLLARVSALESA